MPVLIFGGLALLFYILQSAGLHVSDQTVTIAIVAGAVIGYLAEGME